MSRLLVLNNYDLARVQAEVARGDKPAHHLFGIDALRRSGWEIELIPPNGGSAMLRSLDAALQRCRWPVPLGSLAQQWPAWCAREQCTAIYAPCQTQTHSLAYAGALGILRVPLVTLAHHPLQRGRLQRLRTPFLRGQLAGTAAFPTLSTRVASDLNRLARRDANFSVALPWGPELAYYDRFRVAGPGHGAVTAGRTGRDWPTFLAAAAQAGVRTMLYTTQTDDLPAPANVEVHRLARETDLTYPRLLPALARARVHAVPLRADNSLAGLTSVADALGLGKPLVMTRHPLIDLDLEGEGIGRWVEPGDVAGWAEALRWFESHPSEAEAMGRRARAVAEAHWNYTRFCDALSALLHSVIHERTCSTVESP